MLLNDGSDFLELLTLIGYNKVDPNPEKKAGGAIIGGLGKIGNQTFIFIVSDFNNKSGAIMSSTVQKILRLQEISLQNKLPIIYIFESSGIYLPEQHELYFGKNHIAKILFNQVELHNEGIHQIGVVTGVCIAGAAFIMANCPEIYIVENQGAMCLAASFLTKATIGHVYENTEIGGSKVLMELSGTTDYVYPSEIECLENLRKNILQFQEKTMDNDPRILTNKVPPLLSDEFYKVY